jgi:hypothetical protein
MMTAADMLCVYYKVDTEQHAATAPHVQRFQAALLKRWPGLVCELLQRPEATAGVETWMETYRHASGLSAPMVDFIAQTAVSSELPTPRHTERFVSLR